MFYIRVKTSCDLQICSVTFSLGFTFFMNKNNNNQINPPIMLLIAVQMTLGYYKLYSELYICLFIFSCFAY